jgi:hypothetical protein
MQPYLLPYLGYYQLFHEVDVFVIYDDIQFTKKGWINRNNLPGGNGRWNFTLPLNAGPSLELVSDKSIAPEYNGAKILARIQSEYKINKKFPTEVLNLVEEIFMNQEINLFKFILTSLRQSLNYLEMDQRKILVSSEVGNFRKLKSQDKVVAICKELKATHYLNPINGSHLYDSQIFNRSGLDLTFIKTSVPADSFRSESEAPFSIIHHLLTQEKNTILSDISHNYSLHHQLL